MPSHGLLQHAGLISNADGVSVVYGGHLRMPVIGTERDHEWHAIL